MFDSEAHFLKSLMKEVSLSIDPLHNKYINYITEGDMKIFIPCKLYIFVPAMYRHGEVKYVKEQLSLSRNMLQAECIMQLGSSGRDHVEYATEVLKILQDIKQKTDQHISIAHLYWKHISLSNEVSIRQLTFSTLKISQNLTSICMWDCKIPPPIYEHIVSQLQHCDNLQRLDLSKCHSVDIGKAIAASKSLSDVHLYDSVLSTENYKYVAKELCKHKEMKRLHLNRTKGVPVEMADAITGMKSLHVFRASGCGIDEIVAEPLLKGLVNCHDLKEIQLSMNHLTGCLTHLFPVQTHEGFHLLTRLWIKGTYLNREDVIALTDALHANKLPQLEHLDISLNYNVAGTLSILLNGTDHPGFPFLKYLDLMKVQLTGKDLNSVAESVRHGRMPKLRRLTLDKNNLSAMEIRVKILVQNCVNIYKKLQVLVQVFDTNLSETFVNELQSLCEDSVVLVRNTRS